MNTKLTFSLYLLKISRFVLSTIFQVLKGLLNKNPQERLGCHPQTGFTDITNHAFYKTIDWELVCLSSYTHKQ